MTDYHNVDDQVEAACALYITSRGSSTLKALTVLKGGDETAGATPCVVIVAGPCTPFLEADPNSGDWDVPVELEIETNVKDTTRAVHSALVAALRDILVVSDLASHMNSLATTPLYAIEWTISSLTKSVAGDVRRQGLKGVLTCNLTRTA